MRTLSRVICHLNQKPTDVAYPCKCLFRRDDGGFEEPPTKMEPEDFDISLRMPVSADVQLRRDQEGVSLRRPDDRSHGHLLHNGARIPISDVLIIGRDPDVDVQLLSGLVSPSHAKLEWVDGAVQITDLGSVSGIYVNGEHFMRGSRGLASGDSIAIGGEVLYFLSSHSPLAPVEILAGHSRLSMDRDEVRIGRASNNDVVLDHPRVSPLHAVVTAGEHGARIKDVSKGGDGVRVNGRVVTRTFLRAGDEIAIGPYRLIFDGSLLQQRRVGSGLRMEAEEISFAAGARVILPPLSLAVQPGEFVAVIGPSGSGKSTLLKSLCGVHRLSGGRVTVDGEPVRDRTADLGYVPQDEIVHPLLTVAEALGYAAELRLPQDTPAGDQRKAVSAVLDEVGLRERADVQIAALSGGQRKRVGVASELISQPGMLFLDEPTSGLDPGLENRLMRLFRDLSRNGRATILVTHATRSLSLCDKVLVMGEGGHLAFTGSPAAALEFFGVEQFDDIYVALEERPAADWATDFKRQQQPPVPTPTAPPDTARAQARRPVIPQVSVLVRRRLRVLSRDSHNLWILCGQVPVIAVLLVLLFHTSVFRPRIAGGAGQSAQLLFLLLTVALWFGSLASAREIVKERALMARETAVGVQIPAYLLSKAFVLGAVTGLQTVILGGIVFALRPLHASAPAVAVELAILVLVAWCGVAMGLLVSAYVRSEDQAASFVPMLLIPQLLFGGSVMPVHQMGVAIQVLSKVVVAQWAFAALGNGIHMNRRISEDPVFRTVSHYGHSFFGTPASVSVLACVCFTAVCAALLGHRLMQTQDG